MNSGMNPNLIRSIGCAWREQVDIAAPADAAARPCLLLFLQEAHGLLAGAPRDHLFQPHERAAADEQDVGGVHRREFLVRMLAAALRRNVGDRAFQDLQQRLLHALARNIAGDRGVLVLAADLVDFVDVDDALLALLHVAIGGLQQLEDDVLHILAHVPGFGQGGGVHDRERHVQDLGQSLRHQGLAGAGGTDQQDVGLLQFDLAVAHPVHVDPLAVVVHRHRQLLLGGFLPDYVLIQKLLYFQGFRDLVGSSGRSLDLVVFENRVADRNAFVADVGTRIVAGGGDELSDYVLTLMTKRTSQSIIGSGTLHAVFSSSAADGIGTHGLRRLQGREPHSISFLLSPELAFLSNVPGG